MLPQIIAPWTFLAVSWFVAAVPTASNGAQLQQPVYGIKGLQTGINRQTGSARPARRNILDLQKDIPAWSLYIQGLSAFQNQDDDYFLSFSQVAGIHGRPYIKWGNAEQGHNAPLTGYCTHGSVLFLPWHRPYLALFEELIGALIQDIVKAYPAENYATYKVAADNFRIPYWDWASIPTMPDVVNQPTVQIETPSGPQNVTNPTFRYNFKNFPLDPVNFPATEDLAWDAWLARYPHTVRGAEHDGDESNIDNANNALRSVDLKSMTWYALVKPVTFNEFGTEATGGISIESPHNQVHGSVGLNSGHMSYLSYSAFDPLFWLHHANVDRLHALWQVINSNSSLTPQIEEVGTFTLAQNTMASNTTPLTPFLTSADGPYFNSITAQQISTFGYTYPEIQDWKLSPAELKKDVSAAINRLYNPNPPIAKRGSGNMDTRDLLPGQRTREWSVGLRVSKFDLSGERFIVRLFLGGVPQNPKDWAMSSACVGSFPVFPPPTPKVGPLPVVEAFSELSLMEWLNKNRMNTPDTAAMSKYLQTNLEWRAQKFDGTVVPIESLPNLIVTVQDEMVTMGGAITELPHYGEKTVHVEVTKGRRGGYGGAS
ncbi:uncharacterized protein L3040_003180 [Drepanopeziza brunnea f. sp. 'multigermtubi']|nr:hypothetical protein L3040_003180 [Drepanopeziza brunnea f. sp. 'multigermtubi']